MSAKHILNEMTFACSCLPGCFPSEGAMHYVRRGSEIPDFLLPGRAIMKMSPEARGVLKTLTSDDAKDVAPWWINVMCGK